jgi:hypothetical protein
LVKANQKELKMQHAVHNPATIRVADRTDVSDRVTADEVNLDRFHNRIRKVCALVAATLIPSSLRSMFLFTVLIVPQVLWGVASASATPPQTCLANKNETLWTPLPISASGSLKHQSRKPE